MNKPSPPTRFRFWLWLIRLTGVIVPRRLRVDWRLEWEAELRHREKLLTEWDRLGRRNKTFLVWRSLAALWDALLLQPRRLEGEMVQDLRFGVRMLMKHPGFTIIAILTLALGVGANTAIFSVVNAMILRPLPYPSPERLVWVEEISMKTNASQEAWGAHFLDWQAHSRTLEGVAAYDYATRTLTGTGEPVRLDCGKMSASFLPLLGVQALAKGRNFSAAEDAPGGERVAILSHRMWQRRYNGDQDIIGRSVTLNDANVTVIGVLPANFHFFHDFDLWLPLALDPQAQLAGENRYYGPTLARLKPGVSLDQARGEMDTLLQRYETTRPEGRQRIESRTRLVLLQEHFLGDKRRPLLVLLGAVGLVLLIACANVANLLLARALTRRRELAIRAALGAGRLRLARQLLTECLLLATAGGAAGVALAYGLTSLFGSQNPIDAIGLLAGVSAVTIDLRVLGFASVITLLTGLLFGLFPALQLSHTELNDSLKEGARGAGFQRQGLRNALMLSEVALAMVLLVGAGLLIRSFAKLLEVDPGYRAEGLLTARLQLPPRYDEKIRRVQFYEQTLQRLAALPGVAAVGVTSHLPLTGYNWGSGLRVEGRVFEEGEKLPAAIITSVNPDYFRAMGIGLRAGRLFSDGDSQDAPSVALISETLSRKLFPNEDPLGKRFYVGISDAELTTVIGVVSDVRHQGLDREIDLEVYLSYRQTPRPGTSLVLRSTVDPMSLAPALRNAVHEVDPALALYSVRTMSERLSISVAARRFNLLLLGVFAALALLLSGLGVYGVISYVAAERTHEVGVRMALGAQSVDVLRLFIKQGMTIVLLGVGIGLLGGFALTRVMTSLLFDVSANDPLTFAGVALLLSSIALLACYLPARRAARVDPLNALRRE
jgi:putative ABC transport system permease protein